MISGFTMEDLRRAAKQRVYASLYGKFEVDYVLIEEQVAARMGGGQADPYSALFEFSRGEHGEVRLDDVALVPKVVDALSWRVVEDEEPVTALAVRRT